MRWFGLVFSGFLLLASACGGGANDEGAAVEDAATDPVRAALETEFAPALLRDLPLLKEEEASCISDVFLAGLPDFETAPENPNAAAAKMVIAAQAAQERCLTPDRIVELGENPATVLKFEPAEEAFLLAVREIGEGLDTGDQKLLDAGQLACSLARESGSVEALVARLSATPRTSAQTAANLSPLLGRVLPLEELLIFSTVAVVSLCPEVSNR